MSEFNIKTDVLFVGMGVGAVAWYRCYLPAMALGCDYVGFYDDPPKAHYATDNYGLSQLEMCMKACDFVLTSTDYIARAYRHFNRRIFVCENGVDVARYDLKLPGRMSINVGWAGATGHRNAVVPWLQAVSRVMKERSNVNFVSIGENFASGFHAHFPEERALATPFMALEQYPAAMTHMDIALGPAAHTGFYRGKSDLRWLEAGALGIPIVAHPLVYPKIEDGVTGMLAATPTEIVAKVTRLVDDAPLRQFIGANARRYVQEKRSATAVAAQWAEVLTEVASENQRHGR
jgi:glycosyltransferase involved in cell wall biosynthesis